MNKLVILMAVVAALIGSSAANGADEDVEDYSEMRIMPSDAAETAGLTGDSQIFSDFCIQARDEVSQFIEQSVHGAAASVFDAFFTSATDIGTEVLRAQSSAVNEASALIKESAVEQTPGVVSKEEAKENLEQNVENLSLIQAMSQAAKVVINSVIEAAKSQVFTRLALLRSKFDSDSLKDKITEACGSINFDLIRRLDSLMTSTKSSIKQSLSKSQAALLDVISKTRTENVGCLTTSRVAKIAKFCDVLRMAGPSIYMLLGSSMRM